ASSAAPQEVSQSRRNYKAGCWHGVFGEHVRSFPNIFGLTGATARDRLAWSRPDRAASCCSGASAEAVPFPRIAGRSTSLLRFSRRRESNEVGYEGERATRDRGPAAVACGGDAEPPRRRSR